MNFIPFQKFPDIISAKELIMLLGANDISYQVDDSGQRFSLIPDTVNNFIVIKIAESDFEKANSLVENQEKVGFGNLDAEHYIETFEDKDVIEIITYPEEWTKDEVSIAYEIAEERNLDLSNVFQQRRKTKIDNDVVIPGINPKEYAKNTAPWFGFIALASFLNSIMLLVHHDRYIAVGLGITQVVDSVLFNIYGNFGIQNIISSALLSSIFVFFWYYAKKDENGLLISELYFMLLMPCFLLLRMKK